MVHGKRTTLLPEDVEHAMEALSVEPVIVPPRPLPQAPFHAVTVPGGSQGPAGQLYHELDDEIDFATYLKEPLPPALANSAGVKWKAHWLAVEGVQPAIPENPAPTSRSGPTRPQPTTGSAALRQNAKTHLTTELQLYFSRLTAALVPTTAALAQLPGNPPPGSTAHAFPEAERHRLAALASVRSDAAVAGVLAYLIRWVSESITKCLMGATGTIGCLIDVVEAILDNDVLFVEPYVSTSSAILLPPFCYATSEPQLTISCTSSSARSLVSSSQSPSAHTPSQVPDPRRSICAPAPQTSSQSSCSSMRRRTLV